MSSFNHICLLKAPQVFSFPHSQDVSDLTEIGYLAAAVKEDVASVSIPVDFYGRNPYKSFFSFLKSNPVDLVGISTMTGAFNNALKLAEIAKKFNKYVVMGGYHPSALPEDVLKSPHVDAVIIGEGEITLKDLVVHGPSGNIAGLVFKENGRTIHNGYRPVIKNLDTVSHPHRKVRPIRFGEPGCDYSIDTIFTSRGCPWKCTFCANDTINKKWRARSPGNVIEEMEQIHDAKQKKLMKIWDANFLTNVKRVNEICDLMIENKLTNFKIWTETRVEDIVRAEGIMDKLRRVGLTHISLGIESPNAETLKLMKKKNTEDACIKAVKILNRHKIKPQGYFIIGHYSETVEDTKRYPEFAEALGLRHSIFMVMTPYPGTEIFNEYKRENKIRSFNWDLYNNFGTVVETRGMDAKTLKKMHAYCYGRFYTRYGFLNQKKSFSMVIPLVQFLLMLHTVFRADKNNSEEEIKDYLFDFLESGCINVDRPYTMKPPWLLRWFKEITIRFRHSPGKNVDFCITQTKNTRRLMGKRTDDESRVRGITFDLDKIIRLAKKGASEKSTHIACKFEVMKNNPKKMTRNVISLLADRGLILASLNLGWFVASHVTRGTAAVFVDSALCNVKKFFLRA